MTPSEDQPLRVLHLAARLSARGGADQHMLGVLTHLGRHLTQRLLVGHDDGTARAPCACAPVAGLARSGLEEDTFPEADLRALDRAWAEERPDLIHLHNIVSPVVLHWARRRPALLTVQDHRFFCPGRGKWTRAGAVCKKPMDPVRCADCFEDEAYFERIYSLTSRRLSALAGLPLIVLSAYMKKELIATGLPAAAISVLPPFVFDLPPVAAAGPRDRVLFVGRLVAAKGVDDAVAAHALSGLDLPLILAGTGRLRQDLRARGLAVPGWQSRRDLARLYARAAVVVMPSRWQEPFGIVGLEALAASTPVAAFDSGGVRAWHPGEGLVPWGDVAGLAEAMRALSGRSAEPAAGFSATELTERLLAVYRALARRNKGSVV